MRRFCLVFLVLILVPHDDGEGIHWGHLSGTIAGFVHGVECATLGGRDKSESTSQLVESRQNVLAALCAQAICI